MLNTYAFLVFSFNRLEGNVNWGETDMIRLA